MVFHPLIDPKQPGAPFSGDSWMSPYGKSLYKPLYKSYIIGYLWVFESPRIPREQQLNTIGMRTLGVHPIVPATPQCHWHVHRQRDPSRRAIAPFLHCFVAIEWIECMD